MSEIVKRTQILKYKKSGNMICVLSGPWSKHIEKIIILEISSDLQNVVKLRTQKYLNYDLIEHTSYFLEVLAITEKSKWNENLKDMRVIRTISYDDIDKEKWRETELLEDLPVGPYHEIMPEERIWAGEREGNLGAGIALLGFVIFLFFIAYRLFVAENTIFSIIFAVGSLISSYWLITFSWELPRSSSKEKLEHLKEYKSFLINSIDDQTRKSRTTVEKMLEDFSAVALSNLATPILLLSTTLLDVPVSVVPLDELFLQDEIVRLKNKIRKMNKILFIFSSIPKVLVRKRHFVTQIGLFYNHLWILPGG